jgi:hypothetical protein
MGRRVGLPGGSGARCLRRGWPDRRTEAIKLRPGRLGGPALALLTRGAIALLLLVAPAPAHAQGERAPRPAQTDVASYRLEATLDVGAKQIRGRGRITYRNPSDDALDELWLHLYLNAFRSASTLWLSEAGDQPPGSGFDPARPGWIRVDQLSIAGDGTPLTLTGADADDTIARLPLPSPLTPGQTLELDVRWTSQLPRVFARTGFAGDFFMAGQWYPKLAVYDRGRWDSEPWHANAEFFHDFGSYDLALTVPAEYTTGASGVRLGTTDRGDGTKTVRYRAEPVTDLAWTAWPHFRSAERAVDANGQAVQVELLLPPDEVGAAERYFAATALALDGYSRWYGQYPWPKLTVVVPPAGAEGAGQMEYPTLVTTQRVDALPLGLGSWVRGLELVTVHEIGHQWFPMQVQSNEAVEPFLDEAFAEYLSMRLLDRRFGPDRSLVDLPGLRVGLVPAHRAEFVRRKPREPIDRPAWAYSPADYSAVVYAKGSLVLLTLEGTLGDARFTGGLRAYADRWRWRHPTIADFQAELERSTGQPLDSFFGSVVRGREVAEYRVASVEASRAVVERVGEAAIPVDVRLTLADGTARVEQWDAGTPRLELDGQGTAIREVAVDPCARVPIELVRLDDARVERVDPTGPLAATLGWLRWLQSLGQILGWIG